MTFRKNILTLLTFLLIACNGQQESEINSEHESELNEEIGSDVNSENDLSNSARLFAQKVLKENLREHLFDLSQDRNPQFLKIFCSNGLETVSAYSDKDYPKKTEPEYYEHFTLFVATYSNIENAEECFEQLKIDSKHEFAETIDFQKEISERIKLLTYGAKSGGMITQYGYQIFGLVETCRKPPIHGNWLDYENQFLEYITKDEYEIEVLNADCGMNRYQIEKRKASR